MDLIRILITNNSENKFSPMFKSKKYDNVIVFDFDLDIERKFSEKIRNFIESNKDLIFNKYTCSADIFLEDDAKTLVLSKYLSRYREDVVNEENKLLPACVRFHPIYNHFILLPEWM